MKRADKTNARYVVMLGDTELARDEVTVKDMHSGVQTTVSREAVVQRIAAADMSTRD
jgi:histidyl-tRNA synthetase